MGAILKQEPVKLICGLFWNPEVNPETIYRVIEAEWGPMDARSPVFDFDFTAYYHDEMGAVIQKQYVSFEKLVDIETIADYKIRSNALEDQHFTRNGKRAANVDPGYIADAKLVMATTKNLPHRVYIGKNIYSDLQMMYKKPTFFPIPWTFADVKQPALIEFFNHVRETYIRQIKTLRQNEV